LFVTRKLTKASTMKAKKSYGQHFLNREDLAEKISQSIRAPEGRVLEVGPGKGVLTKYLLNLYPHVKCVEADQDMVDYLKIHFPNLADHLIWEDFLKVRLEEIFEGKSFGLIGNFPYNISSQIVFKMLQYRHLIPEMVGMFQKEVAQRIVSQPGSKEYGIISILVQADYEGEYLFSIGPSAFTPPPKVNSGVIRLLRRQDSLVPTEYRLFKMLVKTTFQQRRKMLRNTLKPLVEDASILSDAFFDQRPEQLNVMDFVHLKNRLSDFILPSVKPKEL
jgi:16S rRNA (adenine1518-N6/adenine1519-N6)-dimethyltransferase